MRALSERDRRADARLRAVLARDARPLAGGAQRLDGAVEHHHFSGASLSLTAQTYRRCGGLPVRAALEDEALERELRARGVAIHRSRARARAHVGAHRRPRAARPRAGSRALGLARAALLHRRRSSRWQRLLEAKTPTIALVLPAREVAATIGPIAAQAARLRDAGLLDELLVVDSRSRDGSARVAERAGR